MSDGKAIVAVVTLDTYDRLYLDNAVAQALEIAELTQLLERDRKILLKPNLLSTRLPEEAVTTHPNLVGSIASLALSKGCEVVLGDSPPFAGENSVRYQRLCDTTGMSSTANELGVPIVRFEESQPRTVISNGRYYKSFEIAQICESVDLIINIPKLKTHGLTAFSGAIKNIFGCIPGIRKGLFHVQAADDREAFSQMLVDLLGAIRPRINIMDAIIAMEGDGPNAGSPRRVGCILASSDPVALDTVACLIVGIDPMSIDTTRLAHMQGLGCGDISKIEIRGADINDILITDFKQSSGRNDWSRIPAPIRRILRKQLIAYPFVESRECAGCGDCAKACPVNAITPGKPPLINLADCIRCYCCNEVCNYDAVKLKKSATGRLLTRFFRK